MRAFILLTLVAALIAVSFSKPAENNNNDNNNDNDGNNSNKGQKMDKKMKPHVKNNVQAYSQYVDSASIENAIKEVKSLVKRSIDQSSSNTKEGYSGKGLKHNQILNENKESLDIAQTGEFINVVKRSLDAFHSLNNQHQKIVKRSSDATGDAPKGKKKQGGENTKHARKSKPGDKDMEQSSIHNIEQAMYDVESSFSKFSSVADHHHRVARAIKELASNL